MSDLAPTDVIELRQCESCNSIVAHTMNRIGGVVGWQADAHPAACLQPCIGGGGVSPAIWRTGEVHRRNRCDRCKLPRPIFEGERCKCGNAARYITEHAEAACGLCSMGMHSVRISDVPDMIRTIGQLLHELHGVLDPWMELRDVRDRLRGMLGR